LAKGTQIFLIRSDLCFHIDGWLETHKHRHETAGLDVGWLQVAGKTTRAMCEVPIVFSSFFPLSSPSYVSFPHRLKPPPTCRVPEPVPPTRLLTAIGFACTLSFWSEIGAGERAAEERERKKKAIMLDHACHAGDLHLCERRDTAREAASNCNHKPQPQPQSRYVFPISCSWCTTLAIPGRTSHLQQREFLGINVFPSRPRPR
jgi:hypothetical protein